MGREFELKFRAEPAILDRLQADLGPWQEIAMATTYFDAPDGALSRRQVTLRCRQENEIRVCTVKVNLPDGARGEWETQCGDIALAIQMLCKLGAPQELLQWTKNGVIATCGAEFTRLCKTIDLGAAQVELALDRGRLTAGERFTPLCEVEVELKAGPDAAAVAFARTLAEKYGLQPEEQSKFARAKALAEQ